MNNNKAVPSKIEIIIDEGGNDTQKEYVSVTVTQPNILNPVLPLVIVYSSDPQNPSK